jgi:hypothetical protein
MHGVEVAEGERMTEAEWLACLEPMRLLEHIDATDSRKLRALAVACCRRIMPFVDDLRLVAALEAAERFVDGEITADLLKYHHNAASDAYCDAEHEQAWAAVWCASRPVVGWNVCSHAVQVRAFSDWDSEQVAQSALVRDIFGNPFRPVAIDPTWQTSTVLALAQPVYEECIWPVGHLDPDRLAVLADALEDSGCTESVILEHLRGPGPHVRGCFVIDSLLGKT